MDIAEIKKRAVKSFFSLITRQVALRAISFISINIILAKVLPVETLGIFNIATAVVSFFAFFSDIGLGASLIQKRGEVSSEDISTTFTIQQLIVVVLSALMILFSQPLGDFYHLDSSGVWLIRVLAVSFFFSSLKVLPSVLLERDLNFNPLVLVELVETIAFNVILITLAFRGFGVWSFSIAVLARGVLGAVLLYLVAPVNLGIGIHKHSAKNLLSFGVPYQLNSLMALVKDRLIILVIARMIGPLGIGYVTWAQALAYLPLEAMNSVIRVSFPAFSRLQEDKTALTKAVEKSLFVTSVLVYPLIFGSIAVLPAIVSYVVSAKWQPALPSFYLFAISAAWAVISTTLTNTLNAIGKIKTTLGLMIFWTLLTWILTPVLVSRYNFFGIALASFIISFTSILTIVLVKRHLCFSLWSSISLPFCASVLMSVVVYFLGKALIRDRLSLAIIVMVGGTIYLLLLAIFGKKRLLSEFRSLRNV